MATTTGGTGLGGRVRAARLRLRMSREALAFRSGISWSAIAQVESGRRQQIRPSTLSALADVLGVTVDYLVSGGVSRVTMLDHRALIYEEDPELIAGVAGFLEEGLERSEPALAIVSVEHLRPLQDRLGRLASQVEFADRDLWYATPRQALENCRGFMEKALEGGATWFRIFGDPVWSSRPEPEVQPWAIYESMLNLALNGAPATVLCPYNAAELDPAVIQMARETHPRAVEGGALLPCADYRDPGEFILDGQG